MGIVRQFGGRCFRGELGSGFDVAYDFGLDCLVWGDSFCFGCRLLYQSWFEKGERGG